MTCPNCGDQVPKQIKSVVMLTCPSCGTTLYLDGARLRDAGWAGVMHDGPQLIRIGDTVQLGRIRFTARGQARFSYGRGWWDEFWGTSAGGKGLWLSIDEGDVVLQEPLAEAHRPPVGRTSPVGTGFEYDGREWRVIEADEGTCIAVQGSFGDRILVGDTYAYINAQTEDGALLSGEFWLGGQAWFEGRWFDPFEIDVERAP